MDEVAIDALKRGIAQRTLARLKRRADERRNGKSDEEVEAIVSAAVNRRAEAVNRATFDTNIYISAFELGGAPIRLLQMGMDGEIEIAVSQPIIHETIRILREKFAGRRPTWAMRFA